MSDDLHKNEGPLLLLAGPGTGKTYRLAKRIKYLVEEAKVAPGEITVITFTAAAAKQMRDRISNLEEEELYLESANQPSSIRTMHSLGLRILRDERAKLPFPCDNVVTHSHLQALLCEDGAQLAGFTRTDAQDTLNARRVTCDTSRVPLALARQRLLTATFPYFELKDSKRGPSGGFVYKRRQNQRGAEIGGLTPHITSSTIANDEEPKMEVLVDRPERVDGITRVTGPFVVEATIPAAAEINELETDAKTKLKGSMPIAEYQVGADPETHIGRMTEVLRQSKTLRLPGNKTLNFESVRRLNDAERLHAEAMEKNGGDKRVAIVFGPEDGAVTSNVVFEAATAARHEGFQHLYFFGFAADAKALELMQPGKLKIPCTYVAVTPDVVMSDLLKTTRSSEVFSITGLPDADVRPSKQKSDSGAKLYEVEVRGLDIFNPAEQTTESVEAENLPCWMLDTDYNGLSFCAAQVFFPKTAAWDNLKRALGANYEDSVWDHLAGTVSEPFAPGEQKRIAVKVIDERGNELMVVRDIK